MSNVDPPFVAETLVWCNAVRSERGQAPLESLPKGTRNDPESCPCGRATGLYVDHETYGESFENRRANPLPKPVVAFVQAFDDELLPQYDERPWEPDEEDA